MIPIKLTIQGIYSYRSKQTIDFTVLARSGVFGIFGAVGSGKSAILDAIMYALYGETERLSKQDSRQYNMMNLQENEMLIDFEFGLDDGDETYRFVSKARRNKKNFEKVDSPERTAYKRTLGGEWEPMSVTNAVSLLGLSYDNFKRTVIIPQGQCMDFIQLSATERTRMLKELFLLDKYELSRPTAELEKQNDEQRNVIRGRLLELGDYSPELIETAKQAFLELQTKLAACEAQLLTCEAQFKLQDEARALHERVLLAQQQQQAFEKQLPLIAQRESQLAEYEWCKLQFSEILNVLQANVKRLGEHEQSLAQLQKDDAAATTKLTAAQQQFAQVEHTFQTLPQQERLVEQLKTIEVIQKLQIEIQELEQRITKGQVLVTETAAAVLASAERIEAHKEKLSEAKKMQPDVNALWQLHNKIERLLVVENELDKTKKSILQHEESIRQINTAKEQALQSVGIAFPLQPSSFADSEQKYKDEIQKVEREQEDRLVKQQLHRFAVTLTEGDACPLCGATHHPQIFSSETAETEQQQAKLHIATLRKHLEALRDVQHAYQQFEKDQQQLRKTERELSALLHPLAIERNCLQTETLGSDKETIVSQLQQAEQRKMQIESIEKLLDAEQLQYNTLLTNEKKYSAALQQRHTDCEAKRAAFALHRAGLQQSEAVDYLLKPLTEIEQAIATKRSEIEQTQIEHSKLLKEITALNTSIASIGGQCKMLQEAIVQVRGEVLQANEQIATLLKGSKYASTDEIVRILAVKIDVLAERSALQDFRQQQHHATQQLQQLQAEQQQKTKFDALAFSALQQQHLALAQQHKNELHALAQQQTQLEALNQRAQAGASLSTQLQQLDERAQNIATLKRLFYASGFVNYVSTNYLQHLCLQANQRFFKLSQQKLQLEIDKGNAFVVRDFMNNGQLRSIKTLSGGQTFQAALSLALALSDSVQHKHRNRQNFFFIDEGFGSLDKESLRLVFDSLKALRQENRIVGVISHVDELKEEISSFLQVQNNEETGSFFVLK